MNRQKELAKNTIILAVGKICTQFISFLLLPLYTALLTPSEFGIVDLLNTYISLLLPLFNWQFENGLFRFLIDSRGKEQEEKQVITTVLVTNIVQSVIYLFFYFCVQSYINTEYKIFLAIDVVLNIFLNTLLQVPRGLGNNILYAKGSFVSAFATTCLNVIFIAGLKLGALGMFFATVFAKIIVIIYLGIAIKIWKYFKLSCYQKNVFKQIFKYSIPLVPNNLAWWAIGVSDRTVISYALDIAANGIYSVANKFPGLFITFYNIFNTSWTESVSLHIHEEDSDEFLKDVINSLFRLFSSVCLGIIGVMPLVFPLIIDKQYADAFYQIPILMFSVLFQVVVGLYSAIYVALKKSVEIAKTSIYAGIINIVVDILLIKYIGLYAASLSTLISYMVLAIYRYFHVRKFVDIHLNKNVILGTIGMGIIVTCSYYYNHNITNIVTLCIVVIYAIVLNGRLIGSVLSEMRIKLKNRGIK